MNSVAVDALPPGVASLAEAEPLGRIGRALSTSLSQPDESRSLWTRIDRGFLSCVGIGENGTNHRNLPMNSAALAQRLAAFDSSKGITNETAPKEALVAFQRPRTAGSDCADRNLAGLAHARRDGAATPRAKSQRTWRLGQLCLSSAT